MIKIQHSPSDFSQLDSATTEHCGACGTTERLSFQFDYAYQPIVDVASRSTYAHEALVRGPAGEGALSVLSQVTEHKRYRFASRTALGSRPSCASTSDAAS